MTWSSSSLSASRASISTQAPEVLLLEASHVTLVDERVPVNKGKSRLALIWPTRLLSMDDGIFPGAYLFTVSPAADANNARVELHRIGSLAT